MQSFSDGDLDTLASFGTPIQSIISTAAASPAQTRERKYSEYFAKWPVRRWELVGHVKVELRRLVCQQVVLSARYDVSNPDTNRHTAGTAKETLVIVSDMSGAMKIISHHEKISGSNRSDSTSSKSRQRQSERERTYNGRPVIPSPPNIPWPPDIPHP